MPGIKKNSGPLWMPGGRAITLQRDSVLSLTEQLCTGITQGITEGRISVGSRLPSCRDLAVQLGVARGTVRAAYDTLVDKQLLVTKGAAGTWVSPVLPAVTIMRDRSRSVTPLTGSIHAFDASPLPFQMGVPADDAFPTKVWSRILTRHAREMISRPAGYPDPRGSLALRQQLVSYLAISRGMHCHSSEVIITNGYAGALGLICLTMGLRGQQVWIEDPGYLLARKALVLAGADAVAIPVDEQGFSLSVAQKMAPGARVVLVTPGQHAPLGMTLSLARRTALLTWAQQQAGWIIEDDYLGELQLQGRAAPALAALDATRVLHIGTFSKNLSPSLRLGYLVVPEAQAERFAESAALLAPASSSVLHNAVAEFLHDGHFMRHLRRMKRLYAERLELLLAALRPHFPGLTRAALAVVVVLPDVTDDVRIAREALAHGMAPTPLSVWYQNKQKGRRGLVLSVTNMPHEGFVSCAARLKALVAEFG